MDAIKNNEPESPASKTINAVMVAGGYCPKCKEEGGLFYNHFLNEEPYYQCENCLAIMPPEEYKKNIAC